MKTYHLEIKTPEGETLIVEERSTLALIQERAAFYKEQRSENEITVKEDK